MIRTYKFAALAALALVASAAITGVPHADWIDAWGNLHGCRQFVNPYTGFIFPRCF